MEIYKIDNLRNYILLKSVKKPFAKIRLRENLSP